MMLFEYFLTLLDLTLLILRLSSKPPVEKIIEVPVEVVVEKIVEVGSLEETNKLLKHLNKDIIAKEGMTLADIYNIDVEVHKTIKTSKLGF